MKSSSTSSSSAQLSSAFKARCEGMATRYRAEMDLKAFDPLRGAQLAEYLGALVLTLEQLAACGMSAESIAQLRASESWSALLVGVETPIIVTHPRHAATRTESNLMHELAHWALRHAPVCWDVRGNPLRRATDEKEAEYLGGCLQIPRRGLLWVAQKHFTKEEAARHYGSSWEMVRFRCNMTGIPLEG